MTDTIFFTSMKLQYLPLFHWIWLWYSSVHWQLWPPGCFMPPLISFAKIFSIYHCIQLWSPHLYLASPTLFCVYVKHILLYIKFWPPFYLASPIVFCIFMQHISRHTTFTSSFLSCLPYSLMCRKICKNTWRGIRDSKM